MCDLFLHLFTIRMTRQSLFPQTKTLVQGENIMVRCQAQIS